MTATSVLRINYVRGLPPIWSNANFFYDCTVNAKSETCLGMDDPPVSPNYQGKYDHIYLAIGYHAIHVIYSIGIQHDHDCDSLIASPPPHRPAARNSQRNRKAASGALGLTAGELYRLNTEAPYFDLI